MADYYDNTRISDLKRCPRRYYFRHVRHWRRPGISFDLAFGLGWHDAMDVVWGGAHSDVTDKELLAAALQAFIDKWVEEGAPSVEDFGARPELFDNTKLSKKNPFIAHEMLSNYIKVRRPYIQRGEVLSIEQPFVVDMPNMEETYYIGRLDKEFRTETNAVWTIEHKTTGMYKAKPPGFRQDYIDGWSPNSQVDGYSHNGHISHGDAFSGVMIDAVLCHKTHHDIFQFIPVDRHVKAIASFLDEAKYWITRIQDEKANLIETQAPNEEFHNTTGAPLSSFPKNTESCGDYGGCPYRDICKFYHDPASLEEPPGDFIVDKWEPFKILKMSELGLPAEEVL